MKKVHTIVEQTNNRTGEEGISFLPNKACDKTKGTEAKP